MKKLSKIITVILCCAAVMFSSAVFAHAENSAQSAISVPSSVKVGAEFNVTVKFTSSVGIGSVDSILKYNANVVTFVSGTDANGSSGSVKLSKWSQNSEGDKTFTFTLKFKAKAAGSSTFSLSDSELNDYNFGKLTVNNASTTMQVVTDTPLSANNYLSGIKLSSGTLSPSFTKKTLNYKVSVPNSTTTMRVTATCEDSKAKCTVSGSGSLKVGTNKISIVVTAESGAKKTYTVTVTRAAAEGESIPPSSSAEPSMPPVESQSPTAVFIDGSEYTVVENFESVTIPEGFSQTVCTVNGTQVMAVSNSTNAVVMLYLADAEQNGAFFVYNEAEISYIPYRTITVGANTYISLSKPRGLAIPAGFTSDDLSIGEQSYPAWISKDNSDYYMLYLCNINGEPTLYIYDTLEGTIQRHKNFETVTVNTPIAEEPTNPQSQNIWFFICIGLAAVVIGLTATVIILAVIHNKSKKTVAADELKFNDADFAEVEQSHIIEAVSGPTESVPSDGGDGTSDDNSTFGDDFIIR